MAILEWNDARIMAQIRAATMQGVVKGTELIRNEALRLIMQTSKTGRFYRTRGVVHQASAPGEAPASDTGRLVQSITTAYDNKKLAGTVSANTAYAEYLEFGTAKMAERPFMRPALANMTDNFVQAVEEAIAKSLPA
jgi:HK97 gp10 family phage protein